MQQRLQKSRTTLVHALILTLSLTIPNTVQYAHKLKLLQKLEKNTQVEPTGKIQKNTSQNY